MILTSLFFVPYSLMGRCRRKPKFLFEQYEDKANVYDLAFRAIHAPNLRTFARDNRGAAHMVVQAIIEIEDPLLTPEGCSRSMWERFLKLRRERLLCEFESKSLGLEIAKINQSLDESKKREDVVSKAIAAVLAVLSHKCDLRLYFNQNVEFQVIMEKGQCEMEFWNFDAHKDAIMTLPTAINEMNSIIVVSLVLFSVLYCK